MEVNECHTPFQVVHYIVTLINSEEITRGLDVPQQGDKVCEVAWVAFLLCPDSQVSIGGRQQVDCDASFPQGGFVNPCLPSQRPNTHE